MSTWVSTGTRAPAARSTTSPSSPSRSAATEVTAPEVATARSVPMSAGSLAPLEYTCGPTSRLASDVNVVGRVASQPTAPRTAAITAPATTQPYAASSRRAAVGDPVGAVRSATAALQERPGDPTGSGRRAPGRAGAGGPDLAGL